MAESVDNCIGSDLIEHRIGSDLITFSAVPVLDVTVLITGGVNLSGMGYFSGVSNGDTLNVRSVSQKDVGEDCVTLGAVPVLNVTIDVTGGSKCVYVSDVRIIVSDKNSLSVGDVNKAGVGEYCVTLFTEPELYVTVFVTGGILFIYKADVVFIIVNYNLPDVRGLSESCVSEDVATVNTVPELNSTILVTSYLDRLLIADLGGVVDNKVLSVGELGESCVSEYCVTLGAVPVLVHTILVTGGLNLLNLSDVLCVKVDYGGANLVLKIGVGEYCKTLVAVPVLDATILVASCFNLLYVYDIVDRIGDNNRLSVRELGEVNVGEYRVTIHTVPELLSAVCVAGNCDCILVTDLCGVRNNNVLSVRELGESCIGEYCVTLGAVPVLDVTILVATRLNCVNLYDMLAIISDYKISSVGKLGESCIGEYCVTLGAVPVCLGAVLMATCLNLSNIYNVLAVVSDYKVLSVGELGESCVSEYCVTLGAVPVLVHTVLVAACLNLINVLNIIYIVRYDNVLVVGKLGELLVGPHALAVACAVPMLNVSVLMTGGIESFHMFKSTCHGDNKVLSIGEMDESCVSEYCVTLGAVPVLVHTIPVASTFNLINVYNMVYVEGDNNVLEVGEVTGLERLVGPYLKTLGAVPVLDVTVLVAGRIKSFNVNDFALVCQGENFTLCKLAAVIKDTEPLDLTVFPACRLGSLEDGLVPCVLGSVDVSSCSDNLAICYSVNGEVVRLANSETVEDVVKSLGCYGAVRIDSHADGVLTVYINAVGCCSINKIPFKFNLAAHRLCKIRGRDDKCVFTLCLDGGLCFLCISCYGYCKGEREHKRQHSYERENFSE